ncbi:MAG: ABC transporter permease [Flammeovirgaceae bacterium]|nr:ABC transporter permease [Flammeovirgaceae bacterium]
MKGVFKLLRSFCPDHLYEAIEGDLLQKFEKDVKQFGEKRAKRRLLWNVIRFCRPGILLRNKHSINLYPIMISNYLKFSMRNMRRHSVFTFINVTGLVMGIAVCLLMLNYVEFEKSYDKFFPRSKDIVRVSYSRLIDNELQYSKAQIFPAVGETLKETIPAVENYVRMFPVTTHVEAVMMIEEKDQQKTFTESSIYAVDSTFLDIFPLEFLEGDRSTALNGENKIILSESAANKYFGNTEAINKTIHWKGMGDRLVTGVFKDLPANSHLQFNFLTSWMNVYEDRSAWNWDGFYTYLLLRPNTDQAEVESMMQKVLTEKMKGNENANRATADFFLQPIEEIHLHSNLSGEMQTNGSERIINVLQTVAAFILVLALINYLNLSLARAIRRAKEIGVRKIIGSSRHQLMTLFFTESFLLNLIAFIIALAVALLLSPVFNSLTGKNMEMEILLNPIFIFIAFGAIILFSFLVGFYPSRNLASVSPTLALKGGHFSNSKGILRKSLLTIQFVTTILLISATLIIQRQNSFMQNQDLGFDVHQNIVIKTMSGPGAETDSAYTNKINLFKSRVKTQTYTINASVTSSIPGRENEWLGRLRKSENNPELISTSRTRVDADFIETYGLKLVAGRNFADENPKQVILNETAVSMLGYKNAQEAVGNKLMGSSEIIGVIEDFHERSMQEPILASMYTPGQGYTKFITVKINSNDASQTIELLQQQWATVFPDKPFDYFFLDEYFNRQYQKEEQLQKVFGYLSAIGLGIACLGLFGFTYFMTYQRTKEIGIRKTLGATMLSIIKLLSTEFAIVLLLAGAVAFPLSYYAGSLWLSTYPVRIWLSAMDFILLVALVAIFAFASILFLLVRSVNTNATDALKHE